MGYTHLNAHLVRIYIASGACNSKDLTMISTLQQFKQQSMISFLNNLGFFPIRQTSVGIWFLSPFRKETTPSFKVRKSDTGIDVFYDFGDNSHGTMVDLAMTIWNVDTKELYSRLQSESLSFGQPSILQSDHSINTQSPEILKIKELSHPALLQYADSRKIEKQIAKNYLVEVYYKQNDKTLFGIGFKNDKGGYELRSKNSKRTIGMKSATTIFNNENDKRLIMFEGFFDFLSFLSSNDKSAFSSDVKDCNNYCILNSTTPVLSFLSDRNYSGFTLHLFFDNDDAGDSATSFLNENHKGKIQDCRSIYKGFNDLNDWWTQSTFHQD